jgi:hypothetical protein
MYPKEELGDGGKLNARESPLLFLAILAAVMIVLVAVAALCAQGEVE